VFDRHELVQNARLYLVCDALPPPFVEAALLGGVDIVQLRCKQRTDDEILASAHRFAELCQRYQALFILNDRPDLAARVGADGVHIGQDDVPLDEARNQLGADRLIGLSTHTREQIDTATRVDYIGVGPVHQTPTKPGRPAVGLELVSYAAAHAQVPFFAIGGINLANVEAVRAAGAERVAVVRALTEASDPELAARELKGVRVGST
jgi:thiamine-phosphate pyrophosphorylase